MTKRQGTTSCEAQRARCAKDGNKVLKDGDKLLHTRLSQLCICYRCCVHQVLRAHTAVTLHALAHTPVPRLVPNPMVSAVTDDAPAEAVLETTTGRTSSATAKDHAATADNPTDSSASANASNRTATERAEDGYRMSGKGGPNVARTAHVRDRGRIDASALAHIVVAVAHVIAALSVITSTIPNPVPTTVTAARRAPTICGHCCNPSAPVLHPTSVSRRTQSACPRARSCDVRDLASRSQPGCRSRHHRRRRTTGHRH